MRTFIVTIGALLLSLVLAGRVFGSTVLYPSGGGTGIGTATTSDVGKALIVSSTSPFSYTFGTAGGAFTTTTINGLSSTNYLFSSGTGISIATSSTSTITWTNTGVTTTAGNWTGTFQNKNASDFAPSSTVSSQWTTTSTGIYYSGGNVGIGTTAPVAKLDISKTNSDTISLANAAAAIGDQAYGVQLMIQTMTSAPYAMTLQNSYPYGTYSPISLQPLGGNVGIGTTAPATTLDVNGSSTIRGNQYFPTLGSSGCLSLTTGGLTATSSCLTSNTGDWAGTWQTHSPSYFQTALGFTPANSSITISSGGILSGGGDLTTNRTISLSTSTLWNYFTGSSPITFNTSTGAIGFSNPGYITGVVADSPLSGSGTSASHLIFTNPGYLLNSNNLSDVSNTSTALSNLGGQTNLNGAYVSSFNTQTGAATYSVSCVSGCSVSTTTTSSAITVTGGGGSSTSTSPINFIIEYPTASENDAIHIFNASSTIKSCYAVNKSLGDTVTWGLGYSSSRATATSSLSLVAASTTVSTTTPVSYAISSSSPVTGNALIFYTTAASSTQFTLSCQYTTP